MATRKFKRFVLFVALALGILVATAAAGLHFALRELEAQIEQALGGDADIGELAVGWSAIEARNVRIPAPKDWPAQDALRAERIVLHPDLAGLFSARLHVPRIMVEGAYLSVLRTRDGRLRLLPSLLEKPAQKKDGAPIEVSIGHIELREGTLEFFDASVRRPAHRIRLDHLQASVDDVRVPSLSGRTRIRLDGRIDGVRHDGKLTVDGWVELAERNSEIATRLQGADLLAFQPYLIKASETGVKRGTLDLQLKSSVRRNRLHAPGTVTLTGLELAQGGGAFGTFMGIPRQAVVAALADRNGRISMQFTLEGNLDDPKFSLNESFARRMASAAANTLGISIEGLAQGVGSAAQGLGGAIKKLFGQ